MEVTVFCSLEGCVYNECGKCANSEIDIDVNGCCSNFNNDEE